jgi:hypothetical protein
MASIRRELAPEAGPDEVWDAVRDVGAVPRRLGPGFLRDRRLDGDARVATFCNRAVAREPIVDIDDQTRRLVYAAGGGMTRQYDASLQVFPMAIGAAGSSWTADLRPNELTGRVCSTGR